MRERRTFGCDVCGRPVAMFRNQVAKGERPACWGCSDQDDEDGDVPQLKAELMIERTHNHASKTKRKKRTT